MPRLGKKSVKRRSKFKKITKASVAKIAKNVMMKVSETKSAMNNFNGVLRQEFTQGFNLLWFMNQGTGATGITGEQIFLKTINIKGYFNNHFSVKSVPAYVRVLLIKTKKQIVSTGLGNIAETDIFRSELNAGHALRSHVDLHKVDLLYDRTFKMSNDQLPDSTLYGVKRFNKTLRVNKKITWDAESATGLSGWLKDKNIYIIFQSFNPGSIAGDNLAECHFTYSVNYKDS